MRKFLSQFTDKRPNDSTEKAAELFTAAATKWKIAQEFQKAAVSFEMANKCFNETENPFGQVQVRNPSELDLNFIKKKMKIRF